MSYSPNNVGRNPVKTHAQALSVGRNQTKMKVPQTAKFSSGGNFVNMVNALAFTKEDLGTKSRNGSQPAKVSPLMSLKPF